MRGRLYTGSFAVVLPGAMLVMTGRHKKSVISVSGLGANDELDFGVFGNDLSILLSVGD